MAAKVCVSVHRDKGKEATQGSFRQGRSKGKHTLNVGLAAGRKTTHYPEDLAVRMN